jgi:hypothetical protein
VEELRVYVPYYVPQLDVSDDKEVAVALLKLFAHTFKLVIDRLNRVPEKNFIAFLDMLGIKLLPALPARAPLSFALSEGTKEHALIPARTQIAAGEVIFETEKNMLATPAKLTDAYSIDVSKDAIYKSPSHVISGESVAPFQTKLLYVVNEGDKEIFVESTEGLNKDDVLIIGKGDNAKDYGIIDYVFDKKITFQHQLENDHDAGNPVEKVTSFELCEGKNLQEHILYVGHEDLFNITGRVKFELSLSPWDSKIANSEFVSWQYWGETKETRVVEWSNFDNFEVEQQNLILTKNNDDEIKEREINGIKNRWIRCIINSSKISGIQDFEIDTIKVINVAPLIDGDNQGLLPDMGFYNDVPLDFSKPIYPFGKIPKLYDTFSIASQEAFSKKGATITFTIDVRMDENGSPRPNPLLSWEYWDGKGWVRISDFSLEFGDYTIPNQATFIITVEDFPALKPTKVNGQENFWIRVRLVGGHYGQEVCITNGKVEKGNVTPPKITSLSIDYGYGENGENLAHCLTYNNLEFTDVTEECKTQNKVFKPFRPLDDQYQTLYLGFDNKLEKAPVSIFFSLGEQLLSSDTIPRLDWEYYTEGSNWVRLDVLDDTRGLMRSGTVEFVFSRDFKKTKKFEEELYWMRAIGVKDRFIKEVVQKKVVAPFFNLPPRAIRGVGVTFGKRLSYKGVKTIEELLKFKNQVDELAKILSGEDNSSKFYETARNILENAQKRLLDKEYENMVDSTSTENTQDGGAETARPKINSIFLNTTWAVQAETIKGELLGSSDGSANQKFQFTRITVITEEIWINEKGTLSEEEKKKIVEESGKDSVLETKDETGKITELWVRWLAVEDFFDSAPASRHYLVDYATGEVTFGNGVHGMIPPLGRDNIKATYQVGGGKRGNVGISQISTMKASIPFVDRARNPEAAGGGSDVELLEAVFERGPQLIKHRDRAVTTEDFERLAKAASSYIARTKCLIMGNRLTIIIIPQGEEDKPMPSSALMRTVEKHLLERSLNLIPSGSIEVKGPSYKEVGIAVDVVPESIDRAIPLEKEIIKRLKEFLHPLTGGPEKSGWEFGRDVHISDVYALLEGIKGVDHVENLTLNGESKDVTVEDFETVCSGKHRITMTLGGK